MFELAVAVIWSDGPLQRDEVNRARALASVLSVEPLRGGVLGAIADGPSTFAELGFDAFEIGHARHAYSVALWLSPSEPSPRRRGFLEALRVRLGLNDATASALAELVTSIRRSETDEKVEATRVLRAADALESIDAGLRSDGS